MRHFIECRTSNERDFPPSLLYGSLGGALVGASLSTVAHGLGAVVKKINKKRTHERLQIVQRNPNVFQEGEELLPTSEDGAIKKIGTREKTPNVPEMNPEVVQEGEELLPTSEKEAQDATVHYVYPQTLEEFLLDTC